jgi:membrane protein required for beta-lactamase induction
MLSFSRFAHVVWNDQVTILIFLPIYMAHYVLLAYMTWSLQSNYHYHPYKSMNSSRLLWIEFVLVFSYICLYVIGKKIQQHFLRWLISIDKYICAIYSKFFSTNQSFFASTIYYFLYPRDKNDTHDHLVQWRREEILMKGRGVEKHGRRI